MPPRLSYAAPEDPPVKAALIRGIERLTGRRRLERHYASTADVEGTSVWAAALDQLDVTLDATPPAPGTVVPSEGPVVVVANHPFGVLDGLAICRLVSQVRPRFRILVNSVLCRDERVAHHFLPIDFSGAEGARRRNVRSLKAAFRHLRGGGALALFPAGGVATAPRPLGAAEDLAWKPLLARLVHEAEAPVVPVYFDGQNSRLFQLASQVSLTLRLALLLREALRKQGGTLSATLGRPVPYADLSALGDPEALTTRLRRATLGLAD
jgi:putative hemolysin